MSSATATTTYPFTYTTFTNPSPAPFTTPTAIPSIFSFGSALSCASTSVKASASAAPSDYPLIRPSGHEAACVISNAAEINDHAFWDLYECCKGDLTATGKPMGCTGVCKVADGQSWKEVGECLSKRVETVVCKPALSEIGNETESSSSTSGAKSTKSSASGSGSTTTTAQASGSGASAASSSGAVNTAGVVQPTSSKAGLMIFGILALGSAAGMLL